MTLETGVKSLAEAVAVDVKALEDGKVDKDAGKQLSDENYTLAEKDKLSGVAVEATKNRADSENANKEHGHAISDVTGLSDALLTKFDKTDVVQVTGQSTEKVMSQKAVSDQLIGVGQTWQDVKANRGLGINYTNTTGRTIVVSFSSSAKTAGAQIGLFVDGILVSGQIADRGRGSPLSAVVPAGSYYYAGDEPAGSFEFAAWSELR